MNRTHTALAIVVILLLLFALAQLPALRGATPAPLPAGSTPDGEVAALWELGVRLEGELAIERAVRAQLADEVALLRSEVLRLSAAGEALAATPPPPRPRVEATASPPARALGPIARFDPEALVEAGFDAKQVAALHSRLDEIELERLYLRDRAVREGWARTPRHMKESQALDQQLAGTRDEFGDELHDWALYATARPNRVAVTRVMQGSAAAEAGLLEGDVIYSYDGQRIFSTRELQAETTGGFEGESTPVEVVRNGQTVQVYLPRGPLGVSVRPSSQEPSTTPTGAGTGR